MKPPLMYCLPGYEYLADAIARDLCSPRGKLERRTFPDGERYMRILDDVRGQDAVVIGGTTSDGATLGLYDLCCALVKYGVRRLTMVVPYYGYSTMERAVLPGEVVTAKTRARLLSSVPLAREGNTIVLVDLHNEGVTHYFEDNLTAFHVSAEPVVLDLIRELGGDDCIVASTDAGRAKWVEHLANALGLEAAFVLKRRLSGSETEVISTNANVKGRRVVIYDDMIRSGSSLIGAARTYRDGGASSVHAVTTHGLFVGDALNRIRDSGVIDTIASTDSHPDVLGHPDGHLVVRSIAPLLANALLKQLR